jgi:PAS domain S-box-containing protein
VADNPDKHQSIYALPLEERFELLVNAVIDYAIYLIDLQGNVASWNSGAQRIKGYLPEEITGQHFSRFFTEEDRQANLPSRALAIAAKEGRFEAEAWRVRKDGSRFWAAVLIDAVRDSEGNLIGFAKVTRDITEWRTTQEKLRHTQQQLAQSQKMEAVGQLTGGIAHDFNNLLTIIIGNLDTIQRRLAQAGAEAVNLAATLKRPIEMAQQGGHRAAQLTQRLLAFSRKQALEPTRVDCNRLISDMSELLRRTLGETINVEIILAGGLWPTFADVGQLESALLNLAVNARDAMGGGGKMTIETANAYLDSKYTSQFADVTPGQYVLLSVADTGAGIPSDVLDRVFEPFFTTKDRDKGSGLGLAMVHGFVKQSGGHVRIYSELGHGTAVKLYLPRHVPVEQVPSAPAPTVASADAPLRSRSGELILLVEDNDGVREYATSVLEDLGYRVLDARDAVSALSLLETSIDSVDLLFTDVVLPGGVSGRALADAALKRRPALPVLFTTGYTENAIVHHGRLDPNVHLLTKPYTQKDLARKVHELLAKKRG